MCSTEEAHHQYECRYAVWIRHTISTEEARHQYGHGCAVQWRVCSTDLSHHQYGGGCAVRISHIISTDEGVQYWTAKTAQGLLVVVFIWENILQTILLQPRFLPTVVVSRCCQDPSSKLI